MLTRSESNGERAMKIQLILPAIACFFILLSVFQLTVFFRRTERNDEASRITLKVRKRLGIVFLLTGVGLFVLYGLGFF